MVPRDNLKFEHTRVGGSTKSRYLNQIIAREVVEFVCLLRLPRFRMQGVSHYGG